MEGSCGSTPFMKNEEKKQSLARSVIWLVLLICLAWPMSWFLAPVYIFLMPFEALIPQLKDATKFLEKLLTWPRYLGIAIVESHEKFPNPLD